MERPWQVRKSEENGQSIVVFVLFISLLLALAGVIDISRQVMTSQKASQAANAAALAGATVLVNGGSTLQAKSQAQTVASMNGYPGAVVSIPTTGNAVEVSVYTSVSTTFLRVIGIQQLGVNVLSEAEALPVAPDTWALITMQGGSGWTLLNNGTGELRVRGSAFANGAIEANGNASMTATGVIDASAAIHTNGGAIVQGNAGTQPNQPAQPDPLAAYLTHRQPPTPSTTPQIGMMSSSMNGSNTSQTFPPGYYPYGLSINGSSNNVTINPGYYTEDITINGANNTVRLNPGLYYLGNGASFVVNGSQNMIRNDSTPGDGVMFYISGSGSFTLNGGNNARLWAPVSPSQMYPNSPGNLLIWQTGTGSMVINGGNDTLFSGGVYAPQSNLTVNGGNNDQLVNGQTVVNTFTDNGNSKIIVGMNSSSNATTVTAPRLVSP